MRRPGSRDKKRSHKRANTWQKKVRHEKATEGQKQKKWRQKEQKELASVHHFISTSSQLRMAYVWHVRLGAVAGYQPFTPNENAVIEAAFQEGKWSVFLGQGELTFCTASLQLAGVTVPVRRYTDNTAVTISVQQDDGSLVALDQVTTAQILSWPQQPPIFRSMGGDEGVARMIDLIRLVQVNAETGRARALVFSSGPQQPRAYPAAELDTLRRFVRHTAIKLLPTQWIDVPSGQAAAQPEDTVRQNTVAWQAPPDTECSICNEALHGAVRLQRCEAHGFHHNCLVQWFAHRPACPVCRERYSVAGGNQPLNGKMSMTASTHILSGFEGISSGTYIIRYMFPDGIQDNTHANPGRPYTGGTRYAYLPACPEGNAVLARLQIAWQRRLIFTIGESVTVGPAGGDRIIWNGIHHKTAPDGPYGYPDATYLQRVTAELVAAGVVV
jgi:deltex-like protein